jgi:hypothetical protein
MKNSQLVQESKQLIIWHMNNSNNNKNKVKQTKLIKKIKEA